MSGVTWTPRRARVFARGLYHIAACDGVHPREAQALRTFLTKVGLPDDVAALGVEPFDYEEVARALDSSWLRRTFVHASKLMVQMDGEVSGAERDALRALASALGVGERWALADIEQPPPSVDELAEWVAGRPVDFVSWDDERQRGYFWEFPHVGHPIAMGAQVFVQPGQVLTVWHGDEVVDVIGPGDMRLDPGALPGLSAASGWRSGDALARLLFVRQVPTPVLRWGTGEPVVLASPSWPHVPIRAYGRFSLRLIDPAAVARRFARLEVPPDEDVEGRLRRVVSGRFSEALGAITFADDADLIATLNDLDVLRDRLTPALKEALGRSGFGLRRFAIEHLTGPLELGLRPTSKRSITATQVGAALLHSGTGSFGSAPSSSGEHLRSGTLSGTLTASSASGSLHACPRCVSPVPSAARFCAHCGLPQQRSCEQCGHSQLILSRFCGDCGAGMGEPPS